MFADVWDYIVKNPGAVSACVATIALAFNAWTQQRTNLQARAKLVTDALDVFSKDADIQKVYYAIEWGTFRYDPDTFAESEREKGLDKLLRLFANLARLYTLGVLQRRDLHYISYYLMRVVRDHQVQEYLRFMDGFAHNQGLSHPYGDLLSVAELLGVSLDTSAEVRSLPVEPVSGQHQPLPAARPKEKKEG